MSEQATVFIVDDDEIMRRSTERVVRSHGFAVHSFASAREFLRGAQFEGPSCLVLDLQMPDVTGLDLQSELAPRGIEIPVIFLTGHGDIPSSVRAMKAGAVEFLTKPVPPPVLLAAIRAAIEQDRASQRARLELAGLRGRYDRLTPREREILKLVVAGMLNKQIASELGTVERTIKFHRAHIMEKMRAQSLAELVLISGRLGLAAGTVGGEPDEP